MPVARDDLRSYRSGPQPEPTANTLFSLRSDVAEGPDSARDLADAQILGGGAETSQISTDFVIEKRQFEPKSDGLCVDSVGPSNLDGVLKFQRPGLESRRISY